MNRLTGRRQGGFTLIEVLLVLVILVVLASLAVVAYGPIQRKKDIDAARAQIGLFKTPLSLYQLHCGSFPPTLDALIQPSGDPKWSGPYLDSPMVPLDPWGRPYQYAYPGQHNPITYDCWTISPDGVEIGSWN
jgi:general secretion pathway protein G